MPANQSEISINLIRVHERIMRGGAHDMLLPHYRTNWLFESAFKAVALTLYSPARWYNPQIYFVALNTKDWL